MARKLTDLDIVNGIENEGIGYWLLNYCKPKNISNPELRELAATAKRALLAFEEKIDDIRTKLEECRKHDEYDE